MAGQLTIDTLRAGSGVLATQNGMTGIAKAWANWNGVTTVSVRDSFNISSITRSLTGTYIVNLTTAMSNANYAILVSCGNLGGTQFRVPEVNLSTTITTTQFSIQTVNTGFALQDEQNIFVAVLGT